MSIQESDTRLELNDFPDGNFERTYEDRMRQEPQGRGGFGERARAPRQASESHNPHDVMDMSLVRMDVALILEYDPRKKMFHAHLKSGDMADFLALSGDCSNKDMERCILSKVRVASCDGLSAGKWSLNIMDGASRKNQKSLLERKWGVHMGGRFNLTGIPVSLVGKDGKVVFDKDGGVSEVRSPPSLPARGCAGAWARLTVGARRRTCCGTAASLWSGSRAACCPCRSGATRTCSSPPSRTACTSPTR